jgi:hypothetical protein
MNDALSPRPAVWRALGLAAILLLVGAVVLIGIISSGLLDPQPAGPLQAETAPQSFVLAPGEDLLVWQSELPLPPPPYTLRLEGTTDGGGSFAFGLAVGGPDDYLALLVSPSGHASVTHHSGVTSEALLPYRPAPHVPAGQAGHTLQLDAGRETVTIWANRQVLWEGAWPGAAGEVALLARNDGEAPATVSFQPLQLLAPSRP